MHSDLGINFGQDRALQKIYGRGVCDVKCGVQHLLLTWFATGAI